MSDPIRYSYESDEDYRRRCEEKRRQDDQFGTLGFGLDPSCGSIEPSINVGCGLGLGFDGHLTFNPFKF